jgi:hypothetical protein
MRTGLQSAISLSISTPRLMGPGCMMSASGLVGRAGLGQAEKAGVFANARKHRLALALVLDAQQVDDVGVAMASSTLYVTRQPICSKTFGTSVEGPHRVTFAPSLVSAQMFERATRL